MTFNFESIANFGTTFTFPLRESENCHKKFDCVEKVALGNQKENQCLLYFGKKNLKSGKFVSIFGAQ